MMTPPQQRVCPACATPMLPAQTTCERCGSVYPSAGSGGSRGSYAGAGGRPGRSATAVPGIKSRDVVIVLCVALIIGGVILYQMAMSILQESEKKQHPVLPPQPISYGPPRSSVERDPRNYPHP